MIGRQIWRSVRSPPTEETNTIRPRARRRAGISAWVSATWSEEVHVELSAQVVERQQLQRAAETDPGIVDERVEATVLVHPLDRRGDLRGVSHVQGERNDPLAARGHECVAVLNSAHSGQDRPVGCRQPQRRRTADARRGTGDQNG